MAVSKWIGHYNRRLTYNELLEKQTHFQEVAKRSCKTKQCYDRRYVARRALERVDKEIKRRYD